MSNSWTLYRKTSRYIFYTLTEYSRKDVINKWWRQNLIYQVWQRIACDLSFTRYNVWWWIEYFLRFLFRRDTDTALFPSHDRKMSFWERKTTPIIYIIIIYYPYICPLHERHEFSVKSCPECACLVAVITKYEWLFNCLHVKIARWIVLRVYRSIYFVILFEIRQVIWYSLQICFFRDIETF